MSSVQEAEDFETFITNGIPDSMWGFKAEQGGAGLTVLDFQVELDAQVQSTLAKKPATLPAIPRNGLLPPSPDLTLDDVGHSFNHVQASCRITLTFRKALARNCGARAAASPDPTIASASSPGEGKTALHLAAENGWRESLRLLLQRTRSADAYDGAGCTALHLAAKRGQVSIIHELLSAHRERDIGLNINARNHAGMTALHIAAATGHHAVIQVLLDDAHIDADARVGW